MQKIGLLVVAPILISPILSGELRSEAITATLVSIFGLNSDLGRGASGLSIAAAKAARPSTRSLSWR
jgi:hypothetical protein